MTSWAEVKLERGDAIRPPAVEQRPGVWILLRLPGSLHERLLLEAELEGVGLHQLLVGLLASAERWRAPNPARVRLAKSS